MHSDRRPHGPRRPPHRGGEKKDQGWHHVAGWYHDYLESSETLQDRVVYPGVERLLAPARGKSYLDVACGEGAFAARLAKTGAKVVGFDAAPALIRIAERRRVPGAEFLIADATEAGTRALYGRAFDGAACILAIQNIRDAERVFAQTASLLKPGAPFVIVLNHPAFRIPRQSMWGHDEKKKLQYRRIERYLSPMNIPIEMSPGAKHGETTMSYHHPLAFYVNELARAGFLVDQMEEWTSHKESKPGGHARAENRARDEFPLFLAIRARKTS